MKSLKILGVLLCVATLSACAVTPKHNVEQNIVASSLDPNLVFERITIADRQGATTWDVTQENGKVVKAVKTNEASTAEQDMALTIVGAVAAPLANGLVAHSLKNRSSDCGSGGCGGGQQLTQVQVGVDSQSTSTSGSSRSGGCASCALLDE
jgi:hypothetical protein